MKQNILKTKKYIAAILLVLVVVSVIGILKFGNLDKIAGKVKVKDAHLSNISTKLSSNVFDASSDSPLTSNGYDQINYELKYKVSDAGRDVIITGTLNDDERYATFKRVTGDNITSTLSNNDRSIEIIISNAPANTEITTNVLMLINGAPDGYSVNPSFRIKESTSESYTDITTSPISVSTNSLRGIVRDDDNQGIPNIIISLYKNRELVKETYTNNNGEYIFSDLNEDTYTIKINEEIYEDKEVSDLYVSGDSRLDLSTERIYPFNLQIHKYITKVDAYNVGNLISRSYSNASTVNFPIEKLQSLSGKVYYRIVVENTGKKEGVISAVKDELPEFMSFNEEENSGFELVNGYIYDRNLEGITLAPGESREDSLVLNIVDTREAKTYLNRVTADGEIYNHVVYLLDGQTYKEEDVLEGELTTRPADPIPTFEGWYTDSKYTNKYNFNNPVIKNLVLYGKTAQKYRVEFFDKDPETGNEEPYDEQEVSAGDPVTKPDPDPTHTGYTFEHWCKTDLTEYIFGTPVNENLKLITCYKINEYDINFYNYSDTVEKNIKVEYKHLIDETEAPTFDETGYTFLCWSENKSDCFDFTTPVTKNIDLYPTHEKLNNAVVFNDENRITTKEVPYGDTVEPIADQGKIGHSFRCWSEDRENCFDFTTPIIKNTTVYAIYDINKFTVHFIDKDPELGTEVQYGEDQIVDYGNTATRPDPDPIHTGYTFSEWKNGEETYNFETPVTGDITLISNYNINSYPVRFHNDNEVTTVNVQYKHKVTPIESPTKEHHIFKAWLDINDIPFDFDTLIVDETDLYSSFEEVLAPKVSHIPTMWTNGNVSVTVSKNDSLDDDTGYSYLYKTVEGTYETYESPVTITENTTIIAKAVKSEVGSEVTSHQIVNIDKLNPTVTEFSENSVNRTSAVLNVSSLDNESGINYYEVYQNDVKVGEKHFECYSETTFEGYEACRADLPDERVDTYTVTGLEHSTTYRFKVKVFDKAGNSAFSEEIEVTTTSPTIVARLIGYNNQLFEDTIDPDTGEVIVPKEEKYINFESLEEAFDYEDLYDCKNVQCTIQMVKSTNESVEVLEGQDLTLDLNGKVVSGINSNYTIKNNGDFTLIDSTPESDDAGKLVNTLGTTILNKTGSNLTLGEGYTDREVQGSYVSTTRPYVYGEKVGIKVENNSNFIFFDGKIVAPSSQVQGEGAVNGRVDETEYSYEAVSNKTTVDDREYQVITLSQLVDPEARINTSLYFSKLATAVNTANIGTTHMESEEGNLMQDTEPATDYYFVYDSETDTLVSNNNIPGTTAKSKIIINLENEDNDKILTVDYIINPSSTGTKGNAQNRVTLFNNHGKSDGTQISKFTSTSTSDVWYLDKGKTYVLLLSYYQNSIYNPPEDYEPGSMVINNISLSDYTQSATTTEKQSKVEVRDEDFYYDEDTNTLRSNSQYVCKASTAYSSTEIDLTGKEGQYELIINSSLETYVGFYPEAYIYIDEDDSVDFNRTNKVILYHRGSSNLEYPEQDNGFIVYGPTTGKTILEGNKKYYLKFRYRKGVNVSADQCPTKEDFELNNNSDQLIIHSIDLVKVGSESEEIDIFKRTAKKSLFDEFIESSGGVYFEEDGILTSDNHVQNRTINAQGEIDLTNNTKGGRLEISYKVTEAEDGTTTNPTFSLYRIYTQDGEQKEVQISNKGASNETTDTEGYKTIPYNLPAGYKYRLEASFTTQNKSNMSYYSNLTFKEISYKELDNIEGNNLSGIYSDSSYGDFVISSNVLEPNSYHDSYIKIDLTNKDKDQLLTFSSNFQNYDYTRFFIYLTNNNRALSRSNLVDNRNEEFAYLSNYHYPYFRNLYPGSTYNNQYYPSYYYSGISNEYIRQYDMVLEKGKVYYLHFASILNTNATSPYEGYYGNYSVRLENVKLTPIEDTVLNYGGTKIYTGTVDVDSKAEEQSGATARNVSFEDVDFNSLPISEYVYNEETRMYDPQNTEAFSASAIVLKLDLTEATEDKSYIFYGSGYYAIGDEESIPKLEIASLIQNGYSPYYTSFTSSSNNMVTLEKGKVYYIQVASYNWSAGTNNNSFRIDEYKMENTTQDVSIGNEVREFNEEVDTVQLLKDVVVSEKPVSVDYAQEVILDLNGYSLSTTNQSYVIDNSGDLTIIDSKETNASIDEGTNEWGYNSKNSYQTFTAPETGLYTIEAWGAQGGYAYNADNNGGYGGYAKGQVLLEKNQQIILYVGTKGTDATTFTNKSPGAGSPDGKKGSSNTTQALGAGGGSTFVYINVNNAYSAISHTYETSIAGTLLDAAGGGGAYATDLDGDSVPQTQLPGGNGNTIQTGVEYSNETHDDGDLGTGGGFKRAINRPTGTSASGGISYVNENMLANASIEIDPSLEASEEAQPNTYKKGNGYLKITLDKVSNGSVSTTKTGASSAVINNQELATLTLKSGTYSTTGTNSNIINNRGNLVLDGSTVIKVKNTKAIGINNNETGTISTSGGSPKISLETSGCSTSGNYNTIGLKLSKGNSNLSNLNIVGKNGVGIYVSDTASANIHDSYVYITDTCSANNYFATLSNQYDGTATTDYNKNFSYSYKIYRSSSTATSYTDRYDGSILNYGNITFDNASQVYGRINNLGGTLTLTDGTDFNDLFVKGGTVNINNVDVVMNNRIYNEGLINIGSSENETDYKIVSTYTPNIINVGKLNTKGGEIASVYNLGTTNTNNTDFEKFYNLNTYLDKKPTVRSNYAPIINYNGVASLKGGTIKNNTLVNESEMTIDGTTVEKGILNRKNLVVKGNSNVKNDNGSAIYNNPFFLQYETRSISGSTQLTWPVHVVFPTSVTIGDDDGTVNNEPVISTTASTNAITGRCYDKLVSTYNNVPYRNYVDKDIEFFKRETTIYRTSENLLSENMTKLDDYYKDNTLCNTNYYDGTLKTVRHGSLTSVTDIAMENIASGYDIYSSHDAEGMNINLLPLESSQRQDLFEVNGTRVKSLRTALNLAPENETTTITQLAGTTFESADKVVIPENKAITLDLSGNGGVLLSKNPVITNNGSLSVTGNLNQFLVKGQYMFENNNMLNINKLGAYTYNASFETFYRKANLLRNNGTAVLGGNISTRDLDIVDKGTLILNSGTVMKDATIYSYGSNVIANNPTFNYCNTNNGDVCDDKYYTITYFKDKKGKDLSYNFYNSKPMFTTYPNDEGVGSTITINNLAYSNFYMGEFNNATVNINNSDTYWFWLANALINNGTLNLNSGNFEVGAGALKVSGVYNQQNSNVYGGITLADDTIANVKSGNLTTSGDSLNVFTLGKNDVINIGVKGGTTSKTNPRLTCGSYCFGNVVDSDELNLYDGILTGIENPANITINEIEDGYDLIYNRKKNPKEVYLDILPIIHNYTTGNDYYDIQQAFDAANTNDELILLRDYTNYSDSVPLEIASGKKIKLYLNYILDFDANDNMIYTPYKEGDSVSDISLVETPIVTINNDSTSSFLINNGELTIYSSTLNSIPFRDDTKNENFVSNSGARIITNNGTLNLYEVSASSTLSVGTMFDNTGTMNVRRGNYETSVNTVFNNSGTFNIIAASTDTSTCYNPTYIYVNIDSENLPRPSNPINRYSTNPSTVDSYNRSPIKETIINTGTMDITHLYINADYGYTLFQNEGTITLRDSSLEQMKKVVNETTGAITYRTRPATYAQGESFASIVNIGTITLDNVTTVITGHIYNTDVFNVTNDTQLNVIDDGIYNLSGKLTITDSEVNTASIGIISSTVYDTTITNSNINSNSQVWYDHNNTGNLTIVGGTFTSHGIGNTNAKFEISSNPMMESCSNNTPVTTIIDGSHAGTYALTYFPYIKDSSSLGVDKYHLFSGFTISNMNLSVKDATIEYSNAFTPTRKYSSSTLGPTALINSDSASVTLDNVIIDAKNNDKVYGVRTNDDLSIKGSEIESIYNYGINNTVNIGEKDNANADKPHVEKVMCSSDNTQGINLYDGYVYMDYNNTCLFNDKETNYNIVGENAKRYLSADNYIYNVDKDDKYNSIDTALTAASSGDTLQLIKDVSLPISSSNININKDITIDLNSHNLDAGLTYDAAGTLTITDSSYIADNTKSRGRIEKISVVSGIVVVNEGEINIVNNASTFNMTAGIIGTLNNSGSSTISGTTITTINNTGTTSVSNATVSGTITNDSGSTLNLNTVSTATINNSGASTVNITDTTISNTFTNNDTSIITTSGTNSGSSLENNSSTPITISDTTFGTVKNVQGNITFNGANITYMYNSGTVTIGSGTYRTLFNSANGAYVINSGSIYEIINRYIYYNNNLSYEYNESLTGESLRDTNYVPTVTINDGTITYITNNITGDVTILGGNVICITTDTRNRANAYAPITLGSKDGTVNTSSPVIYNPSGYAITTSGNHAKVNFYDGRIMGRSATSIINATITDMETNYLPSVSPDYDEESQPTGTYSMTLKLASETDVKIACVNGICYNTLQEAIDASAQNCGDNNVCPTVTIGDEIYFSIELDADLSLLPQYSLTLDLNNHNLNRNGYTIPSNITVTNGTIDGGSLQSSLVRFLSNVFGTNDTTKDIIITKMEDGNALDTAKTYKLYKLENEAYLPIKVDADGAGKYSIGKSTTDMKSIKGRIYINNVDAGEYMLKDNLDNELEFTIYDDGNLSPNIRENIISEYGHMSASAVATLIISIQTGILRVGNILIALAVIILIIIILLLYKKKSINKKETI